MIGGSLRMCLAHVRLRELVLIYIQQALAQLLMAKQLRTEYLLRSLRMGCSWHHGQCVRARYNRNPNV